MLCVSISDSSFVSYPKKLASYDLAEIRLDLIRPNREEIARVFKQHKKLIATCRPDNCSASQRMEMLETAIEAGAAFVDIEIESAPHEMRRIGNLAKKHVCKLIVSYHNYTKTPTLDELHKIVSNCFDKGADIAKIACFANSTKDTARVLSLYDKFDNILALAMGNWGKISRVAAIKLGAPFTFVALEGKNTAPGQLDYAKMKTIIQNL